MANPACRYLLRQNGFSTQYFSTSPSPADVYHAILFWLMHFTPDSFSGEVNEAI
jgi:hypothetical protein